MKSRAISIWNKYFDTNSDSALNVDFNIDLQSLKKDIDNPNPSTDIFSKVQDNITFLFRVEFLPNFLHSDFYKKTQSGTGMNNNRNNISISIYKYIFFFKKKI